MHNMNALMALRICPENYLLGIKMQKTNFSLIYIVGEKRGISEHSEKYQHGNKLR